MALIKLWPVCSIEYFIPYLCFLLVYDINNNNKLRLLDCYEDESRIYRMKARYSQAGTEVTEHANYLRLCMDNRITREST